jgi:integrase
VPANPTRGLEFPVNRRGRDRVASPSEAQELIEALPERDRALWVTAIYAGLRRGELQALRWCDVDLKAGIISIVHGWDREGGLIEPKSLAAERRVPIAQALRGFLLSQRLRQGGGEAGFVFSATGERPFDPQTISERHKADNIAPSVPCTRPLPIEHHTKLRRGGISAAGRARLSSTNGGTVQQTGAQSE